MVAQSIPSPRWLSELGFDRQLDVRGRSSIADILAGTKTRTGIYLLGYSDDTFYIGQALDVVRRFAGHRRLSCDIESFAFVKSPREFLDATEKQAIHQAEALGVRLRNRVHVADVLGSADLDELVPANSQAQWLDHPVSPIVGAADPVVLPLDSPQRWRTDPQFRQLWERPEYAKVRKTMATFIAMCIPVPATTQLAYWSLSALPGTNKSHHPRLACLNVNMMEVLVCGWLPDRADRFWGFANVSNSALTASFTTDHALLREFPGLTTHERQYRAAGGDDRSLEVQDLDLLTQIVQDLRIQAAARVLNLRLMRKGPTIYGKYHCPAFADDVIGLAPPRGSGNGGCA